MFSGNKTDSLLLNDYRIFLNTSPGAYSNFHWKFEQKERLLLEGEGLIERGWGGGGGRGWLLLGLNCKFIFAKFLIDFSDLRSFLLVS